MPRNTTPQTTMAPVAPKPTDYRNARVSDAGPMGTAFVEGSPQWPEPAVASSSMPSGDGHMVPPVARAGMRAPQPALGYPQHPRYEQTTRADESGDYAGWQSDDGYADEPWDGRPQSMEPSDDGHENGGRELDANQVALLEQRSEPLVSRIIGNMLTFSMILSMVLTPFAFLYVMQPELMGKLLDSPFQIIAPIALIYVLAMMFLGMRLAALFGCGPWYAMTAKPIEVDA